jgi:hypothetical protein
MSILRDQGRLVNYETTMVGGERVMLVKPAMLEERKRS